MSGRAENLVKLPGQNNLRIWKTELMTLKRGGIPREEAIWKQGSQNWKP